VDSGITNYQDSYIDGNYPVLYNEAAALYYMLIDCEDSYYVVSAPDPFVLTTEKVTAHFGDPSEDPQLDHNYNTYETLAAENTIRELLESGDDENVSIDNPYVSTDISGSHDTYTSEDDDKIREQMLALGNYNWKKDGTADGTNLVIDVTSQTAKASQWDITASTYSYEMNGLRISMLSGSRSNTTFQISGNINNTLNSERPYVLVVKLLDSSGNLLSLKVIDCRTSPIAASGVTTFSTSVSSTEADVASITAVQFEVY
jgi:hypothetical protein